MSWSLHEQIVATIAANGPLSFSTFMGMALYDQDHGFYVSGGRAGGRQGDFVTSAESGPLFGAVIADWLDGLWNAVGRPREFLVSEVGAGVGTLFRGIAHAKPDCFEALIYTLVEISPTMRASHESLPGENWRTAAVLGSERQHAILANELLDNLVFDIAERVGDSWAPVHVAVAHGALEFQLGETTSALGYLDELVPLAQSGERVPVVSAAVAWVTTACDLSDRLLVFDYAATSAALSERGQSGWLRTYARHVRGSDPLQAVGECDITCDVPLDQLPEPSIHLSQADWLTRQGIDDRVDRAKQVWAERAHIGDLAAMRARSALNEAQALRDESGLGAFYVLEWHQAT